MLTTDLNNLKYVAVEVIKKPGTKLIDVECGAFMGIISHENASKTMTKFIVLQNSPNSVRLYNLTEYGIMTIQAQSADMRYMTVFTKNDQAEAEDVLKQITTAMRVQKRLYSLTPNNELINVDSYTLMPEIVLTGNNLSSSVTDKIITEHKTTTVAGFNTRYINSAACGYVSNYTQHTVQEKPTVLSFKRKGKLPTIDKLNKMRELVVALDENNTTFKIPIPKCDVLSEEQTVDTEQEAHPQGEQSATT